MAATLPLQARFLRPTSWLFRPRTFVLFFLILEIAHILLRPFLSQTVGVDDADQIFFSQALKTVYTFDQPPLYSWIVWLSTQVFGVSITATAAVKYSLVFFIHLFTYLSARRVIDQPRLQVAAGISPIFFYSIGWRVHEADTHVVLASALIMALLWLFLRIVQEKRSLDFFALGLVAGAGLITSGWFIFGLLGILCAGLTQKQSRQALLSPKALLALPGLLVIPLPYALWIVEHWAPFIEALHDRLAERSAQGEPDAWWLRIGFIGYAFFVTSFPFSALYLVLFFDTFRSLPAAAKGDGWVKWFRIYLRWMLGLFVVAVLLVPIERLYPFYVHPYLLPLLPFLFRRVSLFPLKEIRLRWYFLLLAVMVVVVFQSRFQHMQAGPAFCTACRMQTPYPAFGDVLRAKGFSGRGTIVTDGINIAGNMRLQFPDARVLSGRHSLFDPGLPAESAPDAKCLVVWVDPVVTQWRDDVLAKLGVPLPIETQAVEVTLPIEHTPRIAMTERTMKMYYVLFPGPVGECR